MVTPRDPAAFRAEVLRRVSRIERRRRRARVLVAGPAVLSVVLGVLLLVQLRGGGDNANVASTGDVQGAELHSVVVATGDLQARAVAARPDASVWVLAKAADGRAHLGLANAGAWTDLVTFPAGAAPASVVSDVDGAAWLTDPAGRDVYRVTPAGAITPFTTPAAPSATGTLGSDRRFWFSQPALDRLTGIAADGSRVDHQVPTGRHPAVVGSGPDGSVAFGSSAAAKLGTLSSSGNVVEYDLPQDDQRIVALGPGPGPSLWFVAKSPDGASLGRLSSVGTVIDEGHVGRRAPAGISLGPDGRLWFSLRSEHAVEQRSLSRFAERPLDRALDAGSWTLAPNGAMWAVDRTTSMLIEIFDD